MRWHRVNLGSGWFDVYAASFADAVRYLSRCLADRRPYEPGTHIRVPLWP